MAQPHSLPLSFDPEEPTHAGKAPAQYIEMMAHEELDPSEEEGRDILFLVPDIGRYLAYFELAPSQKIAIARTYANYLAAQLPRSSSKKRKSEGENQ